MLYFLKLKLYSIDSRIHKRVSVCELLFIQYLILSAHEIIFKSYVELYSLENRYDSAKRTIYYSLCINPLIVKIDSPDNDIQQLSSLQILVYIVNCLLKITIKSYNFITWTPAADPFPFYFY